MQSTRWFYLRHADGFDTDSFLCVEAGFHIWAARVKATIEVWEKVPDQRSVPRPAYEFGPVELSTDRTIVTMSLGGEPGYMGMKLFEDEFPWEFTYYLPMWFRIDLEAGRRDTLGWFPQTNWGWVIKREQASKLRENPLFKRPTGAA